MNRAQATARALESGAIMADIEREAARQARHVGTVPFNHMIRALSLPISIGLLNDRDDWTRLAGALLARKRSRKS